MQRAVRMYIKNVRNDSAKEGEEVTVLGLVTKKSEVKESNTKDKKKYMNIELQDSTGSIDVYIWNMPVVNFISSDKVIPGETIIAIGGIKKVFKERPQILVEKPLLKVMKDRKIYDFVPCTEYNVDELYNYLIRLFKSIREPYRTIILETYERDKESIKSSPAAKKYHENFSGGLLEHVYKLISVALSLHDNCLFKYLDMDVLIFLIAYHDYAKIKGYTILPAIDLTSTEELIGHISMGAIYLYNELKAHDLSDTTIEALVHAIIAHHGKVEYGSPKPALTPEAKILSSLDKMLSDAARVDKEIDDNNAKEGKIGRDIWYVKYE